MSRARHKARASGGAVSVYAGEGSNVLKEANERKKGGAVSAEGEKGKKRGDHKARARGGAVPGRKRGGGVGANLTPLSTAATTKKLPGEEAGTEGGGHKGSKVANP